jgi:WD40 repeat protein
MTSPCIIVIANFFLLPFRRSPKAHKYAVSACQFYPPDRGVFVTSGKDETDQVKIWDTNRMEPVHKFSFDLPVLDHHMSALQSAKPLIAGSI